MTALPITNQAHATLVQRLLAKEDPEATRHDEAMRRQEHDRLLRVLSQVQAVRDAANQHHVNLICARPSPTESALVESQAKLAAAEAEVEKCAKDLVAFEAAEKMRQHGPLGEIVMLLTAAHDELKAENERIRAALTAAGIPIPCPLSAHRPPSSHEAEAWHLDLPRRLGTPGAWLKPVCGAPRQSSDGRGA